MQPGSPPRRAHSAVIVGNGESLNVTPLARIRYPTFACNRIHKLYPLTAWRPTWYVRTEPPAQEDESESFFAECRLHVAAGELCIFPDWQDKLGSPANIEYVKTCHHFKRPVQKAPPAWHLPYLCDFGTVVTVAMQIAVLKGFEEICLVGCDLDGGHFTEDYAGSIQTDLWRKAHEIAAKSCPIPIYNCTIGGALEVFPRKPIEYIC